MFCVPIARPHHVQTAFSFTERTRCERSVLADGEEENIGNSLRRLLTKSSSGQSQSYENLFTLARPRLRKVLKEYS